MTDVPEYNDRLEPLMKQMEEEKLWTRLDRQVIPRFFLEKNGLLFVYQVRENKL